MQDKEFDKLFREKFEEFEVKPSQNLWPEIDQELNKPKKKPHRGFLWMAASLLIVLSVALWFVRPPQAIKQYGKTKPSNSQKLNTNTKEAKHDTELIEMAETPELGNRLVKQKDRNDHKNKETQKENQLQAREVLIVKKDQSEIPIHANMIESVNNKGQPEEETTIALGKVQLTLAQAEVNETEQAESNKRTGRIKSIGGLVNFVVSKIDKRKDKIIEFKDTDEGSMVSGMNLGFVKIKSQNK